MVTPRVDTTGFRPPPEPEGPPKVKLSPSQWVKQNLFNTWYNTVLTLVLGPLALWVVFSALRFVFVTGRWRIIEVNLTSFMVGLFPRDQLARPWIGLAILAVVVGLGMGVTARAARETAAAKEVALDTSWQTALRRAAPPAALVLVFVVFVRTATPILLLVGVTILGGLAYIAGRNIPAEKRRYVNVAIIAGIALAFVGISGFGGPPITAWGGLMLTLYFTIAGIVLSFPIGVALALGRRSSLPGIRYVCVLYIELIRGVPLITLLFMGWLVIGFFLPAGMATPDRIQRALIAFVLFTAAYVAEIVRGGLQSVPKGQTEAAVALGLSPWKVTRLIVLPQALRNVIPAMVGQFISLFKDTSLVFIIALTDILRVARSVTQQPEFLGQGLQAETLLFISFIYWVGSYWMSRESQRLEKRLGVGER